MKSSTAFALAAFLALSAAAPVEKRDMVTVIDVVNVVETVDVTTTIFVPPGDPRLIAQQAPVKPQVPAAAPAHTTSIAAAYVAPQAKSTAISQTPSAVPHEQQKQAVHAAPASAPASAEVPAKAAFVAAAPAEKAALPAQQQPAPAQQSPAHAPIPSTPSTSTSNSGSTGAACGDEGGQCAGDATTFGGSDGAGGACGPDDLTGYGPNYFALAYEMMGTASNIGAKPSNPNCGRTAEITYNGKTVTGVLADKCMECEGASIDLSPTLFASLFDGATTGRFKDVSWKFTNGPQPVA